MSSVRWTPEEYRARPRDLDPGLGEQICARVANGEALVEICADRDMPLPATFLAWTRQDAFLARTYAQARADRADICFDELTVLASSPDPKVARNRMDAARTYAERAAPDLYGPRAGLTVRTAADPQATAQSSAADEVRRRLEAMAQRAKTRELTT